MNQILKKIFYTGLVSLSLFEILNVYFIMPMPGSQEIKSIDTAYFLYTHRWYFRIASGILITSGIIGIFNDRIRLLPILSIIAAGAVVCLFNFRMNAESMFKQPEKLTLKPKSANREGESNLAICVEYNGNVKAYPIRFLSYHHQVQDTFGGLPLIITYCNVCRTGRAFIPVVRGVHEKFRLVGMDHYNAMFEDSATGSWWRQSTGEAIAGPLKGECLQEVQSMQLSINKLFELFPDALVMQADDASLQEYDTLGKFEEGKSENRLTKTDTVSWKDKSWIIGITKGSLSRAYDWNELKKRRIINDKLGETPLIIVLSDDGKSFTAFERPSESAYFTARNDTLFSEGMAYDFSGNNLTTHRQALKRVNIYQEFWHSWKTFHPGSQENR